MAKIKLSDTMRFLSGKLNRMTGGQVDLEVSLESESIAAGTELVAEATIRSPERERVLDYLLVSLRGQVQRNGKWQTYVQSAEAFHETTLPADHEYVVPVVVVIPEDAITSENGAKWSLRLQAVSDRAIDPRVEAAFEVVGNKG